MENDRIAAAARAAAEARAAVEAAIAAASGDPVAGGSDPPLARIERLAAELDAAAHELNLSANISLNGAAWPEGLTPTGPPIVTCHGEKRHSCHRSARLGPAVVLVARDARDAEVAAKKRHDPDCPLFRDEQWRPS